MVTLGCYLIIYFFLNFFSKIICIGAPRLHEFLKSISVKSILLDFDDRFYTFYSSNEFYRYNMFNHYFFDGNDRKNDFNDFLKNNSRYTEIIICFNIKLIFFCYNSDDRLCLFTDPPFGCRTEALAFTIKTISRTYQQLNVTNNILPVMWIFPYFMETYIQNEMPEMEMFDYKINYTNHKLYNDTEKGRKDGSPIRIFTNIPLKQIDLSGGGSETDLYRWCTICCQWRSKENEHCNKCKTCPSKNGSTYIHCMYCELCVKPNYKHCAKCNRCTQITNHLCENYQKHIKCWICNETGHTEVNCERWLKVCKSKVKRKKFKIGRRVCLLCHKIGHNERNCTKRETILKEYSFLGVKYNMFTQM